MEFYKKALIGGASLLALLLIFKKKGKKMDQSADDKYQTKRTERNIATLHPKIRKVTRQFIDKAKQQGIYLVVTDGWRTYPEQNELYKQGRTKPGKKVTWARAGESNHNFGLAFDCVPIENGLVNYETKTWKEIGNLGKSFGFKWGGDWEPPKTDRPHFEMMFGNTLAMLRNKIKAKNTIEGGYANV